MSEIPRRIRVDLMTPAEKAIYDAQQEVEKLPADVRLTEAEILLSQARDKVADYTEGIQSKPLTDMEIAITPIERLRTMVRDYRSEVAGWREMYSNLLKKNR